MTPKPTRKILVTAGVAVAAIAMALVTAHGGDVQAFHHFSQYRLAGGAVHRS